MSFDLSSGRLTFTLTVFMFDLQTGWLTGIKEASGTLFKYPYMCLRNKSKCASKGEHGVFKL